MRSLPPAVDQKNRFTGVSRLFFYHELGAFIAELILEFLPRGNNP
jgi:hypothetical protein